MKSLFTSFLIISWLLLIGCVSSFSFQNPSPLLELDAGGVTNRRNAIATSTAGITAAALLTTTPAQAAATTTGAEAFVGTYSDPINHPGGKRTIVLLEGKTVGDYQLAEVQGGGGRGEPLNYVLPAAILGDRLIIIDFSPKGGPR